MASSKKRQLLVDMAYFLVAHEPQIHYVQRRPMKLPSLAWPAVKAGLYAGGQFSSDCSEMITALFRWAGLRDPNNMHYDGYGNTETMLAYLPHYSNARMAYKGALVHFNDPDHVSMVVQPSPIRGNPLLFSHGSEAAPKFYRLNVERQFHRGHVFMNISKL